MKKEEFERVGNPHKNKNRIRRCNGFYRLTNVVRKK